MGACLEGGGRQTWKTWHGGKDHIMPCHGCGIRWHGAAPGAPHNTWQDIVFHCLHLPETSCTCCSLCPTTGYTTVVKPLLLTQPVSRLSCHGVPPAPLGLTFFSNEATRRLSPRASSSWICTHTYTDFEPHSLHAVHAMCINFSPACASNS
jgi:hypothetical protein